MTYAKALLKLVLITISVFIIGTIISGYFVSPPRWKIFSRFHRPAKRIIATSPAIVLEDVDGRLFTSCGQNCWHELQADEELPEQYTRSVDCDTEFSLPKVKNVISMLCEDQMYGLGDIQRAFALTISGEVYKWESINVGLSWLEPFFHGGLLAGFVLFAGLVWFGATIIANVLVWLRGKGSDFFGQAEDE